MAGAPTGGTTTNASSFSLNEDIKLPMGGRYQPTSSVGVFGGPQHTGMDAASTKNMVGKKMYYDSAGKGTLEYDRERMRSMEAEGIIPQHLLGGGGMTNNVSQPSIGGGGTISAGYGRDIEGSPVGVGQNMVTPSRAVPFTMPHGPMPISIIGSAESSGQQPNNGMMMDLNPESPTNGQMIPRGGPQQATRNNAQGFDSFRSKAWWTRL